jgi:hypothetical protein
LSAVREKEGFDALPGIGIRVNGHRNADLFGHAVQVEHPGAEALFQPGVGRHGHHHAVHGAQGCSSLQT